MVSIGENGHQDFIIFLDDNGERREWFVKLLDTGPLVKFETKGGRIIYINEKNVIKIKPEKESKGVATNGSP